jgi:MscS family membrane protein
MLRRTAKPLTLGVGSEFSQLALVWAGLNAQAHAIAIQILDIISALFFVVAAYKLTDLVALRMRQRAATTKSMTDDALVPLLDKALKVLVIVVGLLLAMQSLGFNITALLAGVSIGGLAVAFAAQDTIKNLFGSVLILMDKPFQIGDWINVDGRDGEIEEIGFRSTRLRTFENSVVIIPNGRLADLTINNMGLRRVRRYRTMLGVQYDTSPERMEEFIRRIREAITEHPATVKDNDKLLVNFYSYESSSLTILVNAFFEVQDFQSELKARQDLNLSFMRVAAELGVVYAFPTQTLHIASLPHSSS